MKKLLLLRGAPASGKSTFIKENNLEPYVISSDNLRLMVAGLSMDLDSKRGAMHLQRQSKTRRLR